MCLTFSEAVSPMLGLRMGCLEVIHPRSFSTKGVTFPLVGVVSGNDRAGPTDASG